MSDGFNTTVVLDCGCSMRLNIPPGMIVPKLDDWYSCPVGRHSKVREYDQRTGDPIHDRDRQVWSVTFDQETAPSDGASDEP